MNDNEITNVVLNELESSASVNNMLSKHVRIGPKSVELNSLTASSVTTSSVTWKITSSDNQLLSRRIICEFPVSVVVNSGDDNNKLRHYFLNPRADCLHRIFQSVLVNVNGSSVTSLPNQFCEEVQFYTRESDHYHHGGVLSSTPVVPDILFSNELIEYQGTVTPDNYDDLRNYHFRSRSYDQAYPSRLSNIQFQKVGETRTGHTGDRCSGLTFFVRAAIKNPVFSSVASECLANVKDMEISIVFDSSRFKEKLIQACMPYSATNAALFQLTTANISVGIGRLDSYDRAGSSVKVYSLAPPVITDFRLFYHTIQPSMIDQIPETQILPSEQIIRYSHQVGAINNNATVQVTHPEITTSVVPNLILLSCKPDDASLSVFRSDYHAALKDITAIVNGRTYVYTLMTPKDLYYMCCENGLKSTFQSFDVWNTSASGNGLSLNVNGILDTVTAEPFVTGDVTNAPKSAVLNKLIGCGAPLAFKLSSNFGGEMKENLIEPFRLSFRYSATNTSGVNMSFQSNIHCVTAQTLIIGRSMPLRTLEGVSSEEFANALSSGSYVTVGMNKDDEMESFLGGGSFTSSFRDVGKQFLRFLANGNNILQAAAQIYPDRIPNQVSYEANRVAQLGNVLGQQLNMQGSGMLGGSRLDMLRASGMIR